MGMLSLSRVVGLCKPATSMRGLGAICRSGSSRDLYKRRWSSSPLDVIVVGAGSTGSACAYQLARAGAKVLCLEAQQGKHQLGSYHGESRIIRLAYHEGGHYVPLLQRALQLWRELEEEAGRVGELYRRTGGLDLLQSFEGAHHCVVEHELPHEVLTGREVNQRFHGYCLPSDAQALFQPEAGILASEECVAEYSRLARALGAQLAEREPVRSWRVPREGLVEVTTASRTVQAGKLVLCPGAWLPVLVPELKVLCQPQRQVVGWFDVSPHRHAFHQDRFPVFLLQDDVGYFYGFPEFGSQEGMKIGKFYHRFQNCTADGIERAVDSEDEAVLRDAVARYWPMANGRMLKASTCLFTNTPDGHFIIDYHPHHKEVILASACSGHGFKLSSVVGEVLSQLAQDQETVLDISRHRFCPDRPGHMAVLANWRT